MWTLGSVAPQAPLSPQPFPGFTNPLTAEKAPAGFERGGSIEAATTKIEDALFLEARYVRP